MILCLQESIEQTLRGLDDHHSGVEPGCGACVPEKVSEGHIMNGSFPRERERTGEEEEGVCTPESNPSCDPSPPVWTPVWRHRFRGSSDVLDVTLEEVVEILKHKKIRIEVHNLQMGADGVCSQHEQELGGEGWICSRNR